MDSRSMHAQSPLQTDVEEVVRDTTPSIYLVVFVHHSVCHPMLFCNSTHSDGHSEISIRESSTYLRKSHDELVSVGHLRGMLYFFIGGIKLAHTNVFFDGTREEDRLLTDDADVRPKPSNIQILDIVSIEQHPTALWIIESLDELNGGTL